MKSRIPMALFLLVFTIAAGCASSKVSDRRILVNERIPRPDRIWVYDFAATPADAPAESGFAGSHTAHRVPQTAEQISRGRKAGAAVATELVEKIRAMGMPAERASAQTQPRLNDLVIRGYLLSIHEGSGVERVAIGLGEGSSEMKVAVEGYQMTDKGLRRLGSGKVEAGGSKTPGAAVSAGMAVASGNPVGLIVSTGMKVYGEESGSSKLEGRAKAVAEEIAEQLKPRFEQQGWIQ